MSAITDFVFKKNQLQQNAGQNTMDNIFKVAGLGKDIWNTLNTNAQEEKKNTWQNQNDAYRTALEQRLIDYKNRERQNGSRPPMVRHTFRLVIQEKMP
jgi:uncharacterized circularly permuted ATP-grasp superfamily protein